MSAVVPDPAATPSQTVHVVNIANGLTMLRMALVPVFAVTLLYADGTDTRTRLLAAAIFTVAVVTDRFDGEIARKRGLITDFGKLADPIADKALTGTALIGLSILAELPWWLTGVILAREIGVTLLRFWVIRHGVIPASRGGKLKTFTQAVAIGLYVLPLSGLLGTVRWWVMAVAFVLTVVTGVDYVARAITLRRTSPRAIRQREARAARQRG